MKTLLTLTLSAVLGLSQLSVAAPQSTLASPVTSQDDALDEFEKFADQLRSLGKAIESGEMVFPIRSQQRDDQAEEVSPRSEFADYKAAVSDAYYGYQVFILVDKSVSGRAGKRRDGSVRTPQTMYIYLRHGDQLRLHSVHPVSTGKEPAPQTSDTREGFMRVQSAQKTYVSRKYGEAMPFSLWFETEYGTAIHETLQSRCDAKIGTRASAGCIRLCPGEAESVFRLVTAPEYPRSSSIVLFDKRQGVPVGRGSSRGMSRTTDEQGRWVNTPKVVRGFPTFVRIIDGNTPSKVNEIESLIENPTEGFRQYFRPFAPEVLDQFTI